MEGSDPVTYKYQFHLSQTIKTVSMSIIVYNSESLHIQYPEEYLTMLFGEHKMSDLEPVTSDDVRAMFALAISQMYQKEVPQYGTLLEIVSEVNKHGTSNGSTNHGDTQSRVEVERHGAIRLGTPEELSMMRRLLAVLGMEPVDYYDLTAAGIPVHAGCGLLDSERGPAEGRPEPGHRASGATAARRFCKGPTPGAPLSRRAARAAVAPAPAAF